MSGYRIINQDKMHYVTFTIVGWIDVFSRKMYKDIIINSLNYCIKEKGLLLFSYIIMSNHMHLIARTDDATGLSGIIRDFKRFTSKKIIKEIKENPKESRREWLLKMFKYYAKYNRNNSEYQFWKQNNRPIELVSPKWINQKINYIHMNAVKAGLVEKPEHYLYSSASNYLNDEGIIDVEILDLQNDIGFIYLQ